MNFRKENEYLIEIFPQHFFRLICTKITKNPKGEIESYTFKNPATNETFIYKIEEANKFITVIEPVDNLEMFKMYSNWLNFYRKGIHQNLVFAKQVAEQINETIKKRSYVMYGAGSWVNYDFNKLKEVITSLEDNTNEYQTIVLLLAQLKNSLNHSFNTLSKLNGSAYC